MTQDPVAGNPSSWRWRWQLNLAIRGPAAPDADVDRRGNCGGLRAVTLLRGAMVSGTPETSHRRQSQTVDPVVLPERVSAFPGSGRTTGSTVCDWKED